MTYIVYIIPDILLLPDIVSKGIQDLIPTIKYYQDT